ncbi:hypothetical protein H5410_030437 [Solanum commersonii]|uniref:Uncharacterized protein n=1 Tax=Solanum commersonii TaxID=4109 RepID=A0A9J5YEA5_SOLCO|nr:hypothetical protein H5410_030437 [Solanum commersonii]
MEQSYGFTDSSLDKKSLQSLKRSLWHTGGNKRVNFSKESSKMVRIKTKGDGGEVRKEITIANTGLVFTVPIWCETPTRVSSEKKAKPMKDSRA